MNKSYYNTINELDNQLDNFMVIVDRCAFNKIKINDAPGMNKSARIYSHESINEFEERFANMDMYTEYAVSGHAYVAEIGELFISVSYSMKFDKTIYGKYIIIYVTINNCGHNKDFSTWSNESIVEVQKLYDSYVKNMRISNIKSALNK